jgi:hypothetical protein
MEFAIRTREQQTITGKRRSCQVFREKLYSRILTNGISLSGVIRIL